MSCGPRGGNAPEVPLEMQSVIVARPADLTSEGSRYTASIVIIESKAVATTAGSESATHIWTLASCFDKPVQTIGLAERRGLIVVVQVETREADTTRSVAACISQLARGDRLASDTLRWSLSARPLTIAAGQGPRLLEVGKHGWVVGGHTTKGR